MEDDGEFTLFAPPSTAGSSTTLTLSSNSSGPVLRGMAVPSVSRTLFTSPTPFVATGGREAQDDEMPGRKRATIVYDDALPNLKIKGAVPQQEKSPGWNLDLTSILRDRVANLLSIRRRALTSQTD